MSGDIEARYRRLLRWYPRRWRRENGDVLVATALDEAQRTGRSSPTPGERWAAAVHGTGARLDRRLARAVAVVALVLGALAGVTMTWAWGGGEAAGWGMLSMLLSAGVVPALAAVSAAAVLRSTGLLSDGVALVSAGVGAAAFLLGGLSAASWSIGFEEADAGVTRSWFAEAWLPMILSALALGGLAVGVTGSALLSRLRVPVAAHVTVAVLTAIAVPLMLGVAMIPQGTGAALALGLLIVASLPQRRAAIAAGPGTRAVSPIPVPGRIAGRAPEWRVRRLRAVRLLAAAATAAGAVGAAYALTGSTWSVLTRDATAAMRIGIVILLVGAVPFLVALGLVMARRSRAAAPHTWVPVLSAVASVVLLAADFLVSGGSGDIGPLWLTSGFLGGVALGWWIGARLRIATVARIGVGAGIVVVYTVYPATGTLLMLLFALPVFALAVLVFAGRRPRRRSAPSAGAIGAVPRGA
ncbi:MULTISPECIES: hypothetical protein [unclassified Microbacterium]|uniref:hypothetical protein n=1 Tax=unclassified Microbacterium TaxID=2609290 RepID=UPI00386DA5F6